MIAKSTPKRPMTINVHREKCRLDRSSSSLAKWMLMIVVFCPFWWRCIIITRCFFHTSHSLLALLLSVWACVCLCWCNGKCNWVDNRCRADECECKMSYIMCDCLGWAGRLGRQIRPTKKENHMTFSETCSFCALSHGYITCYFIFSSRFVFACSSETSYHFHLSCCRLYIARVGCWAAEMCACASVCRM